MPVRFAEKKLPCDALIYLGTGYCTNGWNTGHGSLSQHERLSHRKTSSRFRHELKVVFHVNHAPRNLVRLVE